MPSGGRTEDRAQGGRRRRPAITLRLALAGLLVAGVASPLVGQQSVPRLTFAGTGFGSFNLNARTPFTSGASGDTDLSAVNDFSDSFLLVRLDRQLFERDRAGAVIGLLFPDAESDLGEVFFNQVQVFYNTKHFAGVLGRTRLSNFLLEFPVLREEDLLEYSFVNNAFSNSASSKFHRYGNVLRAELYELGSRVVVAGQAGSWTTTNPEGERLDDFDVNTLSGSVVYRLPESIRYQGIVRRAGVEVVSQNVNAPEQEWVTSVLGGVALNLTRNPIHTWEIRAQGIRNFGLDGAGEELPFGDGGGGQVPVTLSDPAGRARAESVALVGSLRFLSRPYQLERFQAAMTGAYKRFTDRGASQFALVPNAFLRLGQGVDVGLQYRFEQFDDTLAELVGRKRDQSVQLTLVFRWQMFFNNYFGERDDILSMEHGYIP